MICPAGYIAVGGGFDSNTNNLHVLIGTVSSPFYPGYGYAVQRPTGDYPAAGWFAGTFSHSGANDTRAMTIGVVCAQAAAIAAQSLVTVYEFYNTNLRHYFRTSSLTEAMNIDNGAAGPGWVRTGDNITAYVAGAGLPGLDVCRFYTAGANSHFYTAFADECSGLKGPNTGWKYEGLSFRIQVPAGNGSAGGNGEGLPALQQPLCIQRLQPSLHDIVLGDRGAPVAGMAERGCGVLLAQFSAG